MTVRNFKLVASGNDFVIADARAGGDELDAAGARALCDRHEGVGADGLVTLLPPTTPATTASFMLRNADGSRAAFSGNGARCAALLLHRLGASQAGCVQLETAAGIRSVRILDDGEPARIEVEIGAPRDLSLSLELPPGSPAAAGDFAIVGVPYLAVAVEDVDALDLERVAPPLRKWSAFPEGANVAFYERPRHGVPVRLRTWERGVEGETLSSGTGCAAVALALALHEAAQDGERRFTFLARSGRPEIVVSFANGEVVMLRLIGDARLVAEILVAPSLA